MAPLYFLPPPTALLGVVGVVARLQKSLSPLPLLPFSVSLTPSQTAVLWPQHARA